MRPFKNRQEAGVRLAHKLEHLQEQKPLVLALPRGGVPVAREVAAHLQTSFDLVMVKKIGLPGYPEVAVGAVSEDEKPRLNDEFIRKHGLSVSRLHEIAQSKIQEIRRQMKELRGSRPAPEIENKTVIVVDDGVATGATLLATLEYLRRKNPRQLIVAVPVAARDSLHKLQAVADEVICVLAPAELRAVGEWYEDFTQVENEEVLKLMRETNFHEASP